MNLARQFAKLWLVALVAAPIAVAQLIAPQFAFENLVARAWAMSTPPSQSLASTQMAAATVPVSMKGHDLVRASDTIVLDSPASPAGFPTARPPMPEPLAWALVIGFLGVVILRRVRATPSF